MSCKFWWGVDCPAGLAYAGAALSFLRLQIDRARDRPAGFASLSFVDSLLMVVRDVSTRFLSFSGVFDDSSMYFGL